MTQLEIKQIMMIGKFMGFDNELYVYQNQRDPEPSFIYKTLNEDGNVDCDEFCDINIYDPKSDWNQLITVIERIESIHNDHHGYFGVFISSNSCTIQGTNLHLALRDLDGYGAVYFDEMVLHNKLESTFMCVVRFIEWYNEQEFKNRS